VSTVRALVSGNANNDGCGGMDHEFGELRRLETNDNIRVVWTADSGGKTQTLFKYAVQ
jgi:hypothetical protein